MSSFFKCEGAGNDFVLIQKRLESNPSPEVVNHLCNRQHGVGADGLVLFYPLESRRWRMVIYNADGSRAGMCGNALRCVASHLWASGKESGSHIIVSDRAEHNIEPSVDLPPLDRQGCLKSQDVIWATTSMGHEHRVRLNLGSSEVDTRLSSPWLEPKHIQFVDWVDTGVPHLIFTSLQPSSDLLQFGKFWRWHTHFAPEGANISVAIWNDSCNLIRIRTYERGVEAPTLACGTAAAAAAITYWIRKPHVKKVIVQFDDQLPFLLTRSSEAKSRQSTAVFSEEIYLTGPAKQTYEGRLPVSLCKALSLL